MLHWLKLWIAGYSRFSSCWMGFHRWDMPGGHCERCGKCDDLEECEMQIECPYCNGDGWVSCDGLKMECVECGGTGWE
jgi:hypothetical protein